MKFIGFEVLTAVVMKSIFWDITPYNPLKVNRHSGGAYHVHLKCLKTSKFRFLASFHVSPENGPKWAETCGGFLQPLNPIIHSKCEWVDLILLCWRKLSQKYSSINTQQDAFSKDYQQVSWSAYSSTMKMGALSLRRGGRLSRTTRRCIPKDSLHEVHFAKM
jgi:hypothetical protein